jgi:hypothetical protein
MDMCYQGGLTPGADASWSMAVWGYVLGDMAR